MSVTTPLTGNPRRGSINLAGTTYEVVAMRTDAGADLRFRRGPYWTHIPVQLCPGETVDDPDFWHADAELHGHRWEFRCDPNMRTLTVRDMPQPRRGTFAAVDAEGRVVG
jgi:hypothetical protein